MYGGDYDPVPAIRELFAVWDYGDVSNKAFQAQVEQVLGKELPESAVRYIAKHGQTKTASLTGFVKELHIHGAGALDAYTAQREPPPSQQFVPDDYRPTTAEVANRLTWSRAGSSGGVVPRQMRVLVIKACDRKLQGPSFPGVILICPTELRAPWSDKPMTRRFPRIDATSATTTAWVTYWGLLRTPTNTAR